MKSRLIAIPIIFLWAASVSANSGSDYFRHAVKAEEQGTLDLAAEKFEHAARRLTGKKSAEAWYRAGRNWVDADNPKQTYGRAMACFQRVDQAVAAPSIARGARTWLAVLSKLVSAEDAAEEAEQLKSAIEDAAEGSRALNPPKPPTRH